MFERMGGHFTAFSQGCQVYYSEGIDQLTDNMGEVRPTLMMSVPRLYEKMYTKIIASVNDGSPIKQKRGFQTCHHEFSSNGCSFGQGLVKFKWLRIYQR